MNLEEKTVSSREVWHGKVFSVLINDVTLPDGSSGTREVVRHPGGVGICALNGGNIVLVRQFRYAAGKPLLEIPAGRLEAGEDPVAAGLRELREETGYTAGKYEYFGRILPTPGYDTEVIHLVLAEELTAGDTSPDPGEFVETVEIPLQTAVDMALNGEIEDAKTICALLRLFPRLGGQS